MSAAFDPTTSQVITPSPESPKRWPWIVAVVAAFAAGAATTMVVMNGSSDEKETEPAQEALFENSESPTTFVVEEEPPPLPSPEDSQSTCGFSASSASDPPTATSRIPSSPSTWAVSRSTTSPPR
jgi:hypothetical protein